MSNRSPKKSPSERLRLVFYQHYIKEQPLVEFDEYYESKIELLIEHYKKLLTKKQR